MLVAFAPVRLSVHNYKKTSAMTGGGLFAICDERLPLSYSDKLHDRGFSVIRLPASGAHQAIASHTDIILFRHRSTLIGSAEYFSDKESLANKIRAAGFDLRLSDAVIGEKYPRDAIFNALVIGEYLFCRTATVSRDILSYANEAGLKVVNTNQGYPACTVLPIGDRLAITSDKGMAAALESVGITAILTDESEKISLPPYKNGFIGGCAGALGKTLCFIGDPSVLPYFDRLKECINEAGFTYYALGEPNSGLLDLGGIILSDNRGDES